MKGYFRFLWGGLSLWRKNLVVTVSRRYGCGGRELAGILAKKLDVKLYDRQLIHIAAAKLSINDLPDDDLYELASTIPPMDMTFLPFFRRQTWFRTVRT